MKNNTYATTKSITQEEINAYKDAHSKILVNTSGLSKSDVKVSTIKEDGYLLIEIFSEKICPFSGEPFYKLFYVNPEYKVISAKQENGLLMIYIGNDTVNTKTVTVL